MNEDGEPAGPGGDSVLLAPGAAGAVLVSVSPNGFGAWSKVYKILSDDPDQATTRVRVRAEIRPRFDVEPRLAELGEIGSDLDTLITVRIRSNANEDFKILGLERVAAGPESRNRPLPLELGFREGDSEKGLWLVDLHLKPGAASGSFIEKIRMRTTDLLVPEIDLALKAVVREPVAYPSLFEMSGAEGSFEIRRQTGPPLNILGITLSHAHVDAKLDTLSAGTAYRVGLTLSPDAPPGLHLPWLLVKTDHPEAPLLRIKIRARVEGAGN